MIRKVPLVTGEYYHVLNKSIGGLKIFRNRKDYIRMIALIKYYRFMSATVSYSQMIYLKRFDKRMGADWGRAGLGSDAMWVRIVAYCIMPTHVHFLLKQSVDNGIMEFMRRLQGSYAWYFNLTNKRKGPLWVGRFKGILIRDDMQLLHTTRYIHLNPATAQLVKNAEDWKYSSYNYYIGEERREAGFIDRETDMPPEEYKIFVEDQKDYQQELGLEKALTQNDEA